MGLYAFVSQVIPYTDSSLERLYSYGRALLPHLAWDRAPVHLGDDVELEFYRLQQTSSGVVSLGDDDITVAGPVAVGTGDPEEDKAPLSEIINSLNERFGTEFTDTERLFLEQVHQDAVDRDDIRETARANPFDKFTVGVGPQLPKLMIQRMADNDELVTRCLNDPDFGKIVFDGLLRRHLRSRHNPTNRHVSQAGDAGTAVGAPSMPSLLAARARSQRSG